MAQHETSALYTEDFLITLCKIRPILGGCINTRISVHRTCAIRVDP